MRIDVLGRRLDGDGNSGRFGGPLYPWVQALHDGELFCRQATFSQLHSPLSRSSIHCNWPYRHHVLKAPQRIRVNNHRRFVTAAAFSPRTKGLNENSICLVILFCHYFAKSGPKCSKRPFSCVRIPPYTCIYTCMHGHLLLAVAHSAL